MGREEDAKDKQYLLLLDKENPTLPYCVSPLLLTWNTSLLVPHVWMFSPHQAILCGVSYHLTQF